MSTSIYDHGCCHDALGTAMQHHANRGEKPIGIGYLLRCRCGRRWLVGKSAIYLLPLPSREQVKAIREFVAEVERAAESKMLLTGKLEGAHYAAMKELLAKIEALALPRSGEHGDAR